MYICIYIDDVKAFRYQLRRGEEKLHAKSYAVIRHQKLGLENVYTVTARKTTAAA